MPIRALVIVAAVCLAAGAVVPRPDHEIGVVVGVVVVVVDFSRVRCPSVVDS